MRTIQKMKGFTLIEIMIVVAIIGILAAIAYPSYMEYVRKSNRSDAKTALNDVAQQLQRCFTVYNAYNNTACSVHTRLTSGASEILSESRLYAVTLTAVQPLTYTLTATPRAGTVQVQDLKCATFTLSHAGARGATGSDSANCWR